MHHQLITEGVKEFGDYKVPQTVQKLEPAVYGRLLTILDLGCLGGATWPHTPAGSHTGAPGGSHANHLANP